MYYERKQAFSIALRYKQNLPIIKFASVELIVLLLTHS